MFKVGKRVNNSTMGDGVVVAFNRIEPGYLTIYAVLLDHPITINLNGDYSDRGLFVVAEENLSPISPLFVDPSMA